MQKLWQNDSFTDQTDGSLSVIFLYFLSSVIVFFSLLVKINQVW